MGRAYSSDLREAAILDDLAACKGDRPTQSALQESRMNAGAISKPQVEGQIKCKALS